MKTLKYIFSIIATLILVTSCSDSFELRNGIRGEYEEGYLEFNLSVPDITLIKTRAQDENSVQELSIFVFNGTGALLTSENYQSPDLNNSLPLTLTTPQRKEAAKAYAVANAKNLVKDIENEEDLLKVLIEGELNGSGTVYTVMSGSGVISDQSNTVDIPMYRTISKIYMLHTEEGANIVAKGFEVHNSAAGAYLVKENPTTADKVNFYTTTSAETIGAEVSTSNSSPKYAYTYPSEAYTSSNESGAFIIVSAEYNGGTATYYRLNLKDAEGNPVDLLPNHVYEIEIQEIKAAGHKSAEEAINKKEGDSDQVTYVIHDHAVDIYSMVTDGVHELGVTTPVVYEGLANENNSSISEYLYVRLYSADATETAEAIKTQMADPSLYSVTVTKGSSWLAIGDPEFYGTNDFTEGNYFTENDKETDDNNASGAEGLLIRYPLIFKNAISTEDRSAGEVTVNWLGLTRVAKVSWEVAYNGAEIATVKLNIHKGEGGETIGIADYWKFLGQEGKATTENGPAGTDASTPQLFGVGGNAMSSTMIRNQGFHFPVMYGDIYTYSKTTNPAGGESYSITNTDYSKAWWYEYDIELTSEVLNGSSSVDISITGSDQEFVNSFTVNGNTGNGSWSNISVGTGTSIKLASKYNSYDYCIATLTLTVKGQAYTFDLYHTGFFHYDKGNHRQLLSGETLDIGYYYYEVRKVETSNGVQYWLDRNLGAKSNGLYIQNAAGGSLINGTAWPYTDDSQGGYYFPADAKEVLFDEGQLVEDNLFDNSAERLSPPGYRLPYEEEWDNIRLSSNFHTDLRNNGLTSYYTSYFTIASDGTQIIFPKSRFLNVPNKSRMGDAFAGYYWTGTEAAGIEKDQIGSWLKVMNFTGASSAYSTGFVNRYAMSVRCVAYGGSDIKIQKNPVNLNVKGATHVYLYTLDSSNNMVGIFTFPGKPIGNATAVQKLIYDKSDENYNSSYLPFATTTSRDLSKLFVMFVYVNDNGQSWILSNDGNKYSYNTPPKTTAITDNAKVTAFGSNDSEGSSKLNELEGWPVWNGYNYFFNWKVQEMGKNSPNQKFDNFPTLNNTHIFYPDFSNDAGLADYKHYRIYWPQAIKSASGQNCTGINMWSGDQILVKDSYKGELLNYYYADFYRKDNVSGITYNFFVSLPGGGVPDGTTKPEYWSAAERSNKGSLDGNFEEKDGIYCGYIDIDYDVIKRGKPSENAPEVQLITYRFYWPITSQSTEIAIEYNGISERTAVSSSHTDINGYYYKEFRTDATEGTFKWTLYKNNTQIGSTTRNLSEFSALGANSDNIRYGFINNPTTTSITGRKPSNMYTVYFDNTSKGWSSPNLYWYFSNDVNNGWPGADMMNFDSSRNIWMFYVPVNQSGTPATIIFNDGKSTGADETQSFTPINNHVYNFNKDTGKTYEEYIQPKTQFEDGDVLTVYWYKDYSGVNFQYVKAWYGDNSGDIIYGSDTSKYQDCCQVPNESGWRNDYNGADWYYIKIPISKTVSSIGVRTSTGTEESKDHYSQWTINFSDVTDMGDGQYEWLQSKVGWSQSKVPNY
ncbi:MAG: hypothetical protein J1F16_03515 [Muribaculaceae bacterium]|nr:hypothetical protein [Muribaculaceae bacterium]